MRHRKSFNHLGRTSSHRKAMLANMASSLLLLKRIETTTAKAKALRSYLEPLITKTKNLASVAEKTHAQRVVFSYLKDKYAVKELFGEIGPKIENRPGGYTRILKTGNRLGDNAEMCIIELVDYNENLLASTSETKEKSTRRRRSSKKKKDTIATGTADVKTEETIAEESINEEGVKEEVKEVKEKDSSSEEKTDEKIEVIAKEESKEEKTELAEKEKKENKEVAQKGNNEAPKTEKKEEVIEKKDIEAKSEEGSDKIKE